MHLSKCAEEKRAEGSLEEDAQVHPEDADGTAEAQESGDSLCHCVSAALNITDSVLAASRSQQQY